MTESSVRLITELVALPDLNKLAEDGFGDLVKAVVDVEQRVMAIGGELHADEEQFLLERGSQQANLWASTSTRHSTELPNGSSSIP